MIIVCLCHNSYFKNNEKYIVLLSNIDIQTLGDELVLVIIISHHIDEAKKTCLWIDR